MGRCRGGFRRALRAGRDGRLLALAPRPVAGLISAALFVAGSDCLARSGVRDDGEPGPDAARLGAPVLSWRKVAGTSLAVVFAGEWGDVTQITTASFAARSHDPLVVGPAALLALWAVSAVAVFGGSKLLERVPVRRVRLGAAGALAAPGLCSLLQALTKLA